MGILIILSLYIVFALILGILAYVLKKKHTKFPDCRVGYHNKQLMKNEETWEYANNTAANLCAFFAAAGVIIPILLYFFKVNIDIMIIIFFVFSMITISVILILPVRLSKNL